eukprot:TRINITY_DN37827_c0_g1_i1.p1 TRINITY_DN37827_c0_g1~~TRINITY_DN37827_c0_g1_i1.p1  ORF type:complete len:200 (+),score=41.69 TRINITY_DN37827_c0_g1_i1:136-735(+)
MGGGQTKDKQILRPKTDAWTVQGEVDRSPIKETAQKVAVLGFEGSGTTQIAEVLLGEAMYPGMGRTVPWKRYSCSVDARNLDVWVASGFAPMRGYWDEVCQDASYLVYTICNSDPLRLPMAWSEMAALVNSRSIPKVLIIMTKTGPASTLAIPPPTPISAFSSFAPLANIKWTVRDLDLTVPRDELKDAVMSCLSWLVE